MADSEKINVAIDGPAGAGKSTVSRLVAARLGYIYIDTGAMYRAITLLALDRGLLPEQSDQISELAEQAQIVLSPGETGQQVLLNGENVTERLRSQEVNRQVSAISQISAVRKLLVTRQREMAEAKGVVMDGRDIGTKVLPDAAVKVYLTASAIRRAERRFKEIESHEGLTLNQLAQDIAERDRMDEQRAESPLAMADDAYLLDATDLSIQSVVNQIVDWCHMKAVDVR